MYVIAPSVAPEIEKALPMSKARYGVWAKLETLIAKASLPLNKNYS
tara:strand:- start:513 stop:650 length:138 start_codon:yes stop_codon:yes gene_type:complete